MNETVCLVSFDTDRVKDYIFATPDLKKIRGASALLEILNREDTPRIIREACHSAGYDIPREHMVEGGGTAMVVVPTTDLADQVIAAVERHYRQMTVTGTITGTRLEVPKADLFPEEPDERTEPFGHYVGVLSAQLRQAKDGKGYEPVVPLAAYLRPCNACGRYPALEMDPYEPAQALCDSCRKKLDWNPPSKNRFWNEFKARAAKLEGAASPWLQLDLDREEHKDLSAIGRTARPPSYVGFILADGNRVGALLRKMPDFSVYYRFATGLNDLIRRVTCDALLDTFEKPSPGVAPFEILLMGGDDLMLVVAADAALDVALQITERFETEANELAAAIGLSEHMSLSAGVVIAHDHFPIKEMHDLASDLLRRAKRTSAQADGVGTIDFMVVTEAATTGLDKVRGDVLSDRTFAIPPVEGEEFTLTERPYTVGRLRTLLHYVREFKQEGFPRQSLQVMYEALFQSKNQAQLVTRAALTRAKREHRELGWQFLETFGVPRDSAPWRADPNRRVPKQLFTTPLGDLVEIYPFVGRRS